MSSRFKEKKFKEMQEVIRKNVELAFENLQTHWAMIRGLSCSWYKESIKNIMFVYTILHNIIIEDEQKMVSEWMMMNQVRLEIILKRK